jgi:predicted CXXCH cytochrome family protein
MKETFMLLTSNLALTCLSLMIATAAPGMTAESFAYMPGAGILGSPHDFSAKLGTELANGEYNLACIMCHVTDKAEAKNSLDSKYFPLWDTGSDSKTFMTYNSGRDQVRQSVAQMLGTQPGRISKFCLGCHDGAHAFNNYGRTAIDPRLVARILDTSPSKIVGAGGDLSNHHPIGFDYELVRTANKAIAPESFLMGLRPIRDLLDNGKMECTTCHSVHNTGNTGEKLLWISDRGSALCLSCHLLS